MTEYVVITDDPAKIRLLYGEPKEWRQVQFPNAAEAVAWQRQLRLAGAVALESQGWRFGCVFSEPCLHEMFGGHAHVA